MPKLSEAQRWSIAITRHASSNLSLTCSCIIVYHVVLRMLEQKRCTNTYRGDLVTPYHRLLLGFALADILFSFFDGLGTIMVPANSGVIYGFGTITTCTVQAFFKQFFVATFVYAGSLSVYFLLKVRYNISDRIIFRRYEVWFHLIPWTIAIGTGIFGSVLKIFNPMNIPELGCWVGPSPKNCFLPGGPPCRGYRTLEWATLYAIILVFAWLTLTFIVVFICNAMIYHAIWYQEKRNSKYLAARLQARSSTYNSGPSDLRHHIDEDTSNVSISNNVLSDVPAIGAADENDSVMIMPEQVVQSATTVGHVPEGEEAVHASNEVKASTATTTSTALSSIPENKQTDSSGLVAKPNVTILRKAATQCILYVSTSFLTTVWTVMPHIGYRLGLGVRWRFFFAIMLSAFVPLQGFFNLLIFIRPEYARLRSSNPSWSKLRCFRKCLFSPDLKDPCMFRKKRNAIA